jgi:hypothetical protein
MKEEIEKLIRSYTLGEITLDECVEAIYKTHKREAQNLQPHSVGYCRCRINDSINPQNSIQMEINHPKHYNQYPVEVIDMMIRIFGEEQTRTFCILNAFKYRMRIGHKDDIQDDLAKEKWYLDKAKELLTTEDKDELPYFG